jgi:hypothetical protein
VPGISNQVLLEKINHLDKKVDQLYQEVKQNNDITYCNKNRIDYLDKVIIKGNGRKSLTDQVEDNRKFVSRLKILITAISAVSVIQILVMLSLFGFSEVTKGITSIITKI